MTRSAPLSGIRILDLSRVLAGPWATQTLADLGAEVIKVERPGSGDDTRGWGPPFSKADNGDVGLSAYFMSTNRGKRSITIDFSTPEGQKLIHQLVKSSDVLVENFKVGGLAKLGLDYKTLSQQNPALIYCSITGFGQTGPHRNRTGYDLLVQAMGGLMSLTGEVSGPPMKVGVAIVDIFTGLYASNAILAALFERKKSGQGEYIDLALLDVQIATLANQAQNFLVSGKPPARSGNAHPNIVPYQDFDTSDGHLVIAVGNDTQFARLIKALDVSDLSNDPRFTTNADRVKNKDALIPLLSRQLNKHSTEYWINLLDAAQIPVASINTLDKVFADPQITARHMLVQANDKTHSPPLVGSPIHLHKSQIGSNLPPPELGQHTDQILAELLQMNNQEISSLRKKGVI